MMMMDDGYFQMPRPSWLYVQQLATDENMHYFGLALFWLLSNRVSSKLCMNTEMKKWGC